MILDQRTKELSWCLQLVSLLGPLSYWTIYDLKEPFSNLVTWNMHWPAVHFLQQRFDFWFFPDEYAPRR